MRLTTIEHFKDHVLKHGVTLVALPTGNKARGKKDNLLDHMVVFMIDAVKRKYVSMSMAPDGLIEHYDPKTGSTASEIHSGYSGNAGYMFFTDQKSASDYVEDKENRDKIDRFFRHCGSDRLTNEDVGTIINIIEEKTFDKKFKLN